MKSSLIFLLIVFLLCAVGVVVNLESGYHKQTKQNRLSSLTNVPNWKFVESIPMDPKIVTALELDDYLYQRYSDGKILVTIYVGYYHSSKKVGAAHDPMVCFPGQGWKINNTTKGLAKMSHRGISDFPYATISADLGEQSEYLLYWFQAFDQPAATTLMQKLLLLKNNFLGKGQDNAFVRLSMPCPGKGTAKCEQTLLKFVDDFYPVLKGYITSP